MPPPNFQAKRILAVEETAKADAVSDRSNLPASTSPTAASKVSSTLEGISSKMNVRSPRAAKVAAKNRLHQETHATSLRCPKAKSRAQQTRCRNENNSEQAKDEYGHLLKPFVRECVNELTLIGISSFTWCGYAKHASNLTISNGDPEAALTNAS